MPYVIKTIPACDCGRSGIQRCEYDCASKATADVAVVSLDEARRHAYKKLEAQAPMESSLGYERRPLWFASGAGWNMVHAAIDGGEPLELPDGTTIEVERAHKVFYKVFDWYSRKGDWFWRFNGEDRDKERGPFLTEQDIEVAMCAAFNEREAAKA